jgi:thiol-disulfide isomerase/thioredoxin
MGLVTVSLALAGCSTMGKKSNTAAGPSSRPFTGAPERTEASDSPTPPPEANGFLAGQVTDRFSHRPTDVRIQVVDLQDVNQSKAARIDFQDVKDGYFMIQGLKPGRQYQLIARAKVGDKLLAGITVAQPPNPRLSIYLSEDLVGPETPPLTPNPATPDKKPDPAAVTKDGKPAGGAGAILDPPVKGEAGAPDPVPAGPPTGGSEPGTGAPRVIPVPPLNKVADGEAKNKPGTTVDVPAAPSPNSTTPTPPGPTSRREDVPQWTPVGGAPPMGSAGSAPATSPFCQLFGRKLENFALYGLDGQLWEYRRNRKGKVVLIDFWSTTCMPCLYAIPELKRLQDAYGPYGLEVVGIACEKGSVAEQVEKVRVARARQGGIKYTILLGGSGTCPVQAQFQVSALPTLVLIDDKSECVWRKEGLDPEGKYELEMEIRKRLGLPVR